MNKQKYLGELRRLLVFMTDEDRDVAIERYGTLFDQASPDGLDVFTEALGSPTKNAIRLSRGYEPGSIPELPGLGSVPGLALDVMTAEQLGASHDSDGPGEPGEGLDTVVPVVELPVFELPDIGADGFGLPTAEEPEAMEPESVQDTQTQTPAPEKAPEEETDQTAGPEAAAGTTGEEASAEETPGEEPAPERTADGVPGTTEDGQEPKLVGYEVPEHVLPKEHTPLPAKPKRYMPLWVGIPLFTLVMLAVGLPLAAVVIGIFALLLVPGAALLFFAWLVFVGGLWCGAYIADAVMMFGASFIVLALALAVLWLCLWLGVTVAKLYIRGVRAMGRLCFGRRGDLKYA